tara:strand:+ start:219 stop:473 length:255 start_codon:yes stop_codon:yes gene_type:complete
MYSYLYGHYFYVKDIEAMIDQITEKRKIKRLEGGTMKTSFAEDLKNLMMGIDETIIKDQKTNECKKECEEKCCEKKDRRKFPSF